MNAPAKKTAALRNLGCKVNAYETEAMQQLLEEAGYEIVSFSEKADVYVVNTCSVTNIADRKSRQMLHRAKKNNPNGIVVAAGCYVQTKAKEAKLDTAVDLIIGNNQKQDLIAAIEAYKKDHSKNGSMTEISHRQPYENLSLTHTAGRTRAFKLLLQPELPEGLRWPAWHQRRPCGLRQPLERPPPEPQYLL